MDDTLKMMMKVLLTIYVVHFCTRSAPIFRSLLSPSTRGKDGRRRDPHSLLLCLLLESSSTSVVLMAAKQAALRFLFPFLSLPLAPSPHPFSSFESNGNLLIPNGIVSLQASALHGRQTLPRARASSGAEKESPATRGTRSHGK